MNRRFGFVLDGGSRRLVAPPEKITSKRRFIAALHNPSQTPSAGSCMRSTDEGGGGVNATERLGEEIAFHDRQARQGRASATSAALTTCGFGDDDYLDHETWIRPAFERSAAWPGCKLYWISAVVTRWPRSCWPGGSRG